MLLHRHYHNERHLAEVPAIEIVCQNVKSSTSCSASVVVTAMWQQIWWIQFVGLTADTLLPSCKMLL